MHRLGGEHNGNLLRLAVEAVDLRSGVAVDPNGVQLWTRNFPTCGGISATSVAVGPVTSRGAEDGIASDLRP